MSSSSRLTVRHQAWASPRYPCWIPASRPRRWARSRGSLSICIALTVARAAARPSSGDVVAARRSRSRVRVERSGDTIALKRVEDCRYQGVLRKKREGSWPCSPASSRLRPRSRRRSRSSRPSSARKLADHLDTCHGVAHSQSHRRRRKAAAAAYDWLHAFHKPGMLRLLNVSRAERQIDIRRNQAKFLAGRLTLVKVVRHMAAVRIQRTMLKLLYKPASRPGEVPKISRSLVDEGFRARRRWRRAQRWGGW